MQSLGVKVFYKDFNLGGGGGGTKGGFLTDRRNCSRNLDKRICKIVACSSSSSDKNGSEGEKNQTLSSFISRSQNYALLKQQMEVAAKSEVGNKGFLFILVGSLCCVFDQLVEFVSLLGIMSFIFLELNFTDF